ncbi:pseudaminic acid biosynthesis-associated methylase [Paracoccus sp. p3-h83]|uniref:pseudaminic acid biosynthesis-associated methylase n=1 Tax=Paracoccus sp. p3-h83 TaxID=3342805 RepID=UPI0035B82AE9
MNRRIAILASPPVTSGHGGIRRTKPMVSLCGRVERVSWPRKVTGHQRWLSRGEHASWHGVRVAALIGAALLSGPKGARADAIGGAVSHAAHVLPRTFSIVIARLGWQCASHDTGEAGMARFETDQENFWAGDFGAGYIERNSGDTLLASKVALWGRMLKAAHGVGSIMEFGCNIGLNLAALKRLQPQIRLTGIEINEQAAAQACKIEGVEVSCGSILQDMGADQHDLTFTSGVLIHINPDRLGDVYRNLYTKSRRYVLVAEYYNPSPVAIPYRGVEDRLFKRDFAGDLIDAYGMKLVDYGFAYRRDNWAPQDDITWFLLEK